MASKTETKGRSRSGPKADWKHIGADIPPTLHDRLVDEAKKQGVPHTVVIRWALSDYFAGEAAQGGSE